MNCEYGTVQIFISFEFRLRAAEHLFRLESIFLKLKFELDGIRFIVYAPSQQAAEIGMSELIVSANQRTGFVLIDQSQVWKSESLSS